MNYDVDNTMDFDLKETRADAWCSKCSQYQIALAHTINEKLVICDGQHCITCKGPLTLEEPRS